MPKIDRRARVVAVLTGVLSAAGAVATPQAIGRAGSNPVAVAAHFPQTAPVMVPGPGDAMVSSSTLPASATQATVDVVPGAGTTTQEFDLLTAAVVENYPKLKRLNQKSRRIRVRQRPIDQQHDRPVHPNRKLVRVGTTRSHQSLEYYTSRQTPSRRTPNQPLKLEATYCVGVSSSMHSTIALVGGSR